MLIKKIIGIIIITLNLAGLCYLIYLGCVYFFNTRSSSKDVADEPVISPPGKKIKKKEYKAQRILEKEDDLLKDMDLSDLDDIDLEDFD
ncbi:MAG: hypothetical protein D3926_17885 [Desulfobacteraceae bacterium]|nr:MAG: hypothetical protein D3926_17885 [Desulfobacteraceae bacterium]